MQVTFCQITVRLQDVETDAEQATQLFLQRGRWIKKQYKIRILLKPQSYVV